jgi:class 3 adenylate cyclase
VLFCDIVMFSKMVENCKPGEVVDMLNTLHEKFDRLVCIHDVFRVCHISLFPFFLPFFF